MKRCPKCDLVVPDDAPPYCRADGTLLVLESGAVGEGAQTRVLSPSQGADTSETRILPTAGALNTPTSPTTVLDARPASGDTRELSKPKSRKGVVITLAAVAVLAITSCAYLYLSSGKSPAAKNSIAVLPFQNASDNPDVEYLSDGISESLINSLSQLPDVRVLARSTMFSFKGKEVNPQEVGRRLGVETVLTGKVVQLGDSLSVQADLVNTSDGSQIWGERYQRKAADVLAVQEDIAREIVSRLRPRLSGKQQGRVGKRHTESVEAYQFYLQGRYHWNKRTKESLRRAAEYFRRAVEEDPNYALAYVGLADCYAVFNTYEVEPPDEAYPKARAAAQKALEIDPALGEAYATLASVEESYDRDFAAAERDYRKAIELAPNYATARQWYGEYLRIAGRPDEAVAELRRARELDPLSLIINSSLGSTLFFARRYDEAIEQLRKVIEMDANFVTAHTDLGWCYTMKGMYGEATAAHQKAVALSDGRDFHLASLAYTLAKSGKQGEARKMLEQLNERGKRRYVDRAYLSYVYYALGERDEALATLEKAYQEKSVELLHSTVHPAFDDGFRSDPRFAELVRKVGLPQ